MNDCEIALGVELQNSRLRALMQQRAGRNVPQLVLLCAHVATRRDHREVIRVDVPQCLHVITPKCIDATLVYGPYLTFNLRSHIRLDRGYRASRSR
jgi:hypothetical protein